MISSIRLRRKHVASVYSISSFEEDDEEDDEDEMLVALALRASSIPYSRYVELYEKAREADRGSEDDDASSSSSEEEDDGDDDEDDEGGGGQGARLSPSSLSFHCAVRGEPCRGFLRVQEWLCAAREH
jgi:hypothetical protein